MKAVPNLDSVPSIDAIGVKERVARFNTRSIKKASKIQALKLAMSMMDLTTLEGSDTPGKVTQLCNKALKLHIGRDDIPRPAAVCVYPTFVGLAQKLLKGSDVKVASVATAFPSGLAPFEVRLEDTRFAVAEGADEIDMVISRNHFLSGDYLRVFEEITEVKKVCEKAHLKVILETGELSTLDQVRLASEIAMQAGADFIKTSTGKIQPAATQEVTLVMLEAIRDHYYQTGKRIGMKPAGGIRDSKTAIRYLVMVRETLGNDWLSPDLFRFGASSLANDLLMQLIKQESGAYQSNRYFSID